MLGAHVVEKLRAPRTGGWVCRLCDQVACGRDQGRCPAATAASITDRPALPPDRRPRGARQRFDRRR
jgi:hypothetical protein